MWVDAHIEFQFIHGQVMQISNVYLGCDPMPEPVRQERWPVFQTEVIEFLQSFSTEWLTDFLLLVSRLGSTSFYIPVLILITFGLDFRKGFLLTHMIATTLSPRERVAGGGDDPGVTSRALMRGGNDR